MNSNNIQKTAVSVTPNNNELKNLIIGKAWINQTPSGKSFIRAVIDQRLQNEIILKPGSEVTLWVNDNKREGKKDPDYSISVKLPKEIVEKEIANQKAIANQSA